MEALNTSTFRRLVGWLLAAWAIAAGAAFLASIFLHYPAGGRVVSVARYVYVLAVLVCVAIPLTELVRHYRRS